MYNQHCLPHAIAVQVIFLFKPTYFSFAEENVGHAQLISAQCSLQNGIQQTFNNYRINASRKRIVYLICEGGTPQIPPASFAFPAAKALRRFPGRAEGRSARPRSGDAPRGSCSPPEFPPPKEAVTPLQRGSSRRVYSDHLPPPPDVPTTSKYLSGESRPLSEALSRGVCDASRLPIALPTHRTHLWQ